MKPHSALAPSDSVQRARLAGVLIVVAVTLAMLIEVDHSGSVPRQLVMYLAIFVLAADLVLFVIFCGLISASRRARLEQENASAREGVPEPQPDTQPAPTRTNQPEPTDVALDNGAVHNGAVNDGGVDDRAADAFDRGEIAVKYQPVLDPRSGHCQGVEVLFRWQVGGLCPMSDTEFFALTERTGQIVPIGEFVLRTACDQVSDWTIENAGWPLRLVVKISTRQLLEPGFVELVGDALAESALAPDQLKLELMDASCLASELTIEVLGRLAKLGVRTGVNLDTGTGTGTGTALPAAAIDGTGVAPGRACLDREPMDAADLMPWIQSLADSLSRV